ncbi:MAG: DUF2892 domain-containing protein [Dehalococcoidia bacterium]
MTNQPVERGTTAIERCIASNTGRVARAGLGVALIAAGATLMPAPTGWAVAALGLVPLTTGLLNLCPIAPLWGGHFLGARYCDSSRAGRLQ